MGVEIGQRVSVPSKDVGNGKIVFIGTTEFAKGKGFENTIKELKHYNNY